MNRGRPSRRTVLAGLALASVRAAPAAAAPPVLAETLSTAVRDLGLDPESVRWGDGVALTAPLIAEDGAAVPVTVRVAGGAAVEAVHLFAPANRRAHVASFTPGDAAGRIEVSLRIRLARSQTVSVLVRRADGSVAGAAAEIAVTAGGGCRT